jgi:hypoxanthine-guanine phosphoribosyltransferase
MVPEAEIKMQIEKRILNLARCTDADGVMLTEYRINFLITMLALKLITKYPNKNPVLVVTDRAQLFASKLEGALKTCNYPFHHLNLHSSRETSQLELDEGATIELGNRLVIIVDSLYSKGKSFAKAKTVVEAHGADKVRLIVLVKKDLPSQQSNCPTFSGVKIPHKDYVIGCGLSVGRLLGDLSSILTVHPSFVLTEEEQRFLNEEKPPNAQLKETSANKRVNPGSSPDTIFSHKAAGNTQGKIQEMPGFIAKL